MKTSPERTPGTSPKSATRSRHHRQRASELAPSPSGRGRGQRWLFDTDFFGLFRLDCRQRPGCALARRVGELVVQILDVTIGFDQDLFQAPLRTSPPANRALVEDAVPDTGVLPKCPDKIV